MNPVYRINSSADQQRDRIRSSSRVLMATKLNFAVEHTAQWALVGSCGPKLGIADRGERPSWSAKRAAAARTSAATTAGTRSPPLHGPARRTIAGTRAGGRPTDRLPAHTQQRRAPGAATHGAARSCGADQRCGRARPPARHRAASRVRYRNLRRIGRRYRDPDRLSLRGGLEVLMLTRNGTVRAFQFAKNDGGQDG